MDAAINPAIVVINLDHYPDRYEAFQVRNAHLRPVRRFPAVYGANVDRLELQRSGLITTDLNYSDGAIGCALSHMSLWRDVARGTEALTICEDDAVFAGDFMAMANARLAALPDGWDIVLWGWLFDSTLVYQVVPGHPSYLLHCESLPDPVAFAAIPGATASPQLFRLNRACGTMCYTISPKGAARLLAACTPLRRLRLYVPEMATAWPVGGIDLMMCMFYPQLEAYVSIPPLTMSPNVNSTTKLVVSADLRNRAGRLSLPSLIAEIGVTASTEVELYKAWLLANEGSGLLFAAWFNLGNALARADDYTSAITAFQTVLLLRPDFDPAEVALVWRQAARSSFALRRSRYQPRSAGPGPAGQ